jgi:hypothetical protein
MPQMIQLQSGNSNNWRDVFTSTTEKSMRVLIEIFHTCGMSVICLEKTEQDGKVRISNATESNKHLHSFIDIRVKDFKL